MSYEIEGTLHLKFALFNLSAVQLLSFIHALFCWVTQGYFVLVISRGWKNSFLVLLLVPFFVNDRLVLCGGRLPCDRRDPALGT